jgi:subtilisin family serine protease
MKKFLLFFLLLLVGVSSATAGNITSWESPQPLAETHADQWATVTVPGGLDEQIGFPPAKAQDSNPKMESGIAGLAALTGRDSVAVRQAAESAGLRVLDDRVLLHMVIQPGEEGSARQAIATVGGEVTGAYENTLQVWLPPASIAGLAENPVVNYIHAPDPLVLAEDDAFTVVSEGLGAANVPTWHEQGYNGQGVRIAVIDAGFQGYLTKLGTDLPASVTVKNFVAGESDVQVDATTRHGTACAEIIHDMAPQAELFLLKIATDVDLSQAVNYAVSQGVDIISTSLTFLNATPGDGTGKFATMAQTARNAGVLWVTAAGNYRQTHWGGTFSDPDNDSFHNFTADQEVNFFGPGDGQAFLIPAGVPINASIRWNDWTAVNQDFSLYIVRYNGSSYDIVATSENPQTGQSGQRPTERVRFTTIGSPAVYGVAIRRESGDRDVFFNLLTPNRELDRRLEVLSLGNLADVPAVLTVAAVDVSAPYIQEVYSSEGPTNGPGGTAGGGRRKPDLAAFANVSTTSYGGQGFNGTSAATPHVAGAAAVVRSAYPDKSPAELQDYLEMLAIDQGVPGPDVEFGHGRLYLGPPPRLVVFDYHAFTPFVTRGFQP